MEVVRQNMVTDVNSEYEVEKYKYSTKIAFGDQPEVYSRATISRSTFI